MAQVVIAGASDDLIEIDGDIYEEFNAHSKWSNDNEDDGGLLAFSDGTLLSIVYGREGIWRISPIRNGSATYEIVQGTNDDDDYTDKVTLTGDLKWVAFGEAFAVAKS